MCFNQLIKESSDLVKSAVVSLLTSDWYRLSRNIWNLSLLCFWLVFCQALTTCQELVIAPLAGSYCLVWQWQLKGYSLEWRKLIRELCFCVTKKGEIEDVKEGDHLDDLGINERMILKWILMKWNMRALVNIVIKCREFFWLAEEVLVSQEGICCIGWDT